MRVGVRVTTGRTGHQEGNQKDSTTKHKFWNLIIRNNNTVHVLDGALIFSNRAPKR